MYTSYYVCTDSFVASVAKTMPAVKYIFISFIQGVHGWYILFINVYMFTFNSKMIWRIDYPHFFVWCKSSYGYIVKVFFMGSSGMA